MPDRMSEKMPEDMPDMPERMSKDMPDSVPERMSEDMQGRERRMPKDMPDRKRHGGDHSKQNRANSLYIFVYLYCSHFL